MTGTWRSHPRHGRQFDVASVTAVDPVGERGALAYLARVPGIGKTRARALYGAHGTAVFNEIDVDPVGVSRSIRGVGEKTAQKVADWWAGARGERAPRGGPSGEPDRRPGPCRSFA